MKLHEILISNSDKDTTPAITDIHAECQAEIPGCPSDIRGLQKYTKVRCLIFFFCLILYHYVLCCFSIVFFERLQDVTSQTDQFDSLFTLTSLSNLNITQEPVALSFLDNFTINKKYSAKEFAEMVALYEERSYLVTMVCAFICCSIVLTHI